MFEGEKACNSCYNAIPIDAKYCSYCGKKQHKDKLTIKKIIWVSIIVIILANGALVLRKYHRSIYHFISELPHNRKNHYGSRVIKTSVSEQSKINKTIQKYNSFVFGIDVSHYQGIIQWNQIKTIGNTKVSFAIIRATMGTNSKDQYYTHNWRSAKKIK